MFEVSTDVIDVENLDLVSRLLKSPSSFNQQALTFRHELSIVSTPHLILLFHRSPLRRLCLHLLHTLSHILFLTSSIRLLLPRYRSITRLFATPDTSSHFLRIAIELPATLRRTPRYSRYFSSDSPPCSVPPPRLRLPYVTLRVEQDEQVLCRQHTLEEPADSALGVGIDAVWEVS